MGFSTYDIHGKYEKRWSLYRVRVLTINIDCVVQIF